MGIYRNYELVGGQPVKIGPLEVTKNGTTFADEGCAFNPVVCGVPSALETLSDPADATDGVYIYIATDADEDTVVGICKIAEGAVDESYGDGTFAVDSTGDTPVIEWTPSVTAVSVTVWYAASVESGE